MNEEILTLKCVIQLNQCKPIIQRLALNSIEMDEEILILKRFIQLISANPLLNG